MFHEFLQLSKALQTLSNSSTFKSLQWSWIKIPEVKINFQKTETLLFCIKWHKKHNNYNGEQSIIKILIFLEIELINPRLFI